MHDLGGDHERPAHAGDEGDASHVVDPADGVAHAIDVPVAPTRPGSAVASVVFGVVGVLTSFAVVPGALCGVVAALLARHAADRTGPDTGRPGRGYAVAGQGLAGLALILSAVFGLGFMLGVWGSFNQRHPRRRSQNSTQLRGIHQALVTYANSNKEHYPGLDPNGNIIADSLHDTGLSGDGDTVQARMRIMLTGSFFTPEYVVSPRETDQLVAAYSEGDGIHDAPVLWDQKTRHYSFALLSIAGTPGQPPDAGNRAAEWQQSLNTQSIVASDRNTGTNATTHARSVHTPGNTPGDWRGAVLWNDNHVAFEQSQYFETQYGSGAAFVDTGQGNTGLDNLFAEDNDPAGDPGNDAYMIHQGD